MKFIKLLPFDSILDDDKLDCGLWQSKKNICEFQSDLKVQKCDTSGFYYGTTDELEPKFCARHFYQLVVSGDGKSNYTLKDKK